MRTLPLGSTSMRDVVTRVSLATTIVPSTRIVPVHIERCSSDHTVDVPPTGTSQSSSPVASLGTAVHGTSGGGGSEGGAGGGSGDGGVKGGDGEAGGDKGGGGGEGGCGGGEGGVGNGTLV